MRIETERLFITEMTMDKLLRSNIITMGATVIVLSASDITNVFRGRMSSKQLLKNLTTILGWLGGGYIGAALGGAVGFNSWSSWYSGWS